MADEVKLFGTWGSPISRIVEIALKLKGVPYELIAEDLSNKSPLLLKYNPIRKKIPVLLHNGKPIAELLVILEYIDETWEGYPILPQDPHERARARFWAKFMDEKCLFAPWIACWGEGDKKQKKSAEEQKKAVEESLEGLKTLESALEGKRFFGGDRIGLGDIAASFIAFWPGAMQEVSEVELLTAERFPAMCKWRDEFLSCNIVKENLSPRDKVVQYYEDRFRSG